MTQDYDYEISFLKADRFAVLDMLKDCPEESFLERMGLERRLKKIDSELFELETERNKKIQQSENAKLLGEFWND